ncbi:hypothetical protein GGR53DRAFT_484662 [Hypoxylon sp. FL1150]|nr:hypothetical protein GGR53DRAFT_484662 [Hypoxylon sp. FL1150]
MIITGPPAHTPLREGGIRSRKIQTNELTLSIPGALLTEFQARHPTSSSHGIHARQSMKNVFPLTVAILYIIAYMDLMIAIMTDISNLARGFMLAIEQLMQRSPLAHQRKQIDIPLSKSRTTAPHKFRLTRRIRKDRELAGANGYKKYWRRCKRDA